MLFYHVSAIYSKLLVLPALGFMVFSTGQIPRNWRTTFLHKEERGMSSLHLLQEMNS